MNKSSTIFVFIFLVFLTIAVFFLSKISFFHPIEGAFTFFTTPLQHAFYQIGQQKGETDGRIQKLTEENNTLRKKLVDQKKLLSENSALRDQFQTTTINHLQLLPATIIGAPGFLPGVSIPEVLILDRGSEDGIQIGDVVIFKDNLIGTISRVSQTVSAVSLVRRSSISFTAKTIETEAVGVVHGVSLQNVLLSQNLKKGDVVITKGDRDETGKGFPPDLIVGKITAIDKKPSALFQTALLQDLIDVSKLSTVFILVSGK